MRIFAFILTLILCLVALSGCGKNKIKPIPYDESADQSEHEVSVEEQYQEAARLYPFLRSRYIVRAQKDIHEISYVYDYYFVRGTVAGTKQTVVFADEKSAKTYHQQVLKDCEQAILDDCTVIHFILDDSSVYGFTLDKLKFMLETTEYDYEVHFDEEEFNRTFYSKNQDKQS